MGAPPFTPQSYAIDVIPERLRALEIGTLACFSLLTTDAASFDDYEIITSLRRSQSVCQSALAHAVLSARAVLHFIGIKKDQGGLVQDAADPSITDCGGSIVDISIATQVLVPDFSSAQLYKIFLRLLTVASKSVAHTTRAGGVIPLDELAIGTFAISQLLRMHYFQALGIAAPDTLLDPIMPIKPTDIWLVRNQYLF